MPGCTNRAIGKLLHGYEIGVLSNEDTRTFEQHLIECESCYAELTGFESEAELLLGGSIVRSAVAEVLSGDPDSTSPATRLWRYLWPKGPPLLKPLIAYLAIILLLFPAYRGIRQVEKPTVREIGQIVRLTDARTGLAPSFDKSLGTAGLLAFHFEGVRAGEDYHVVIESETGEAAYDYDKFSSFDRNEIGRIYLPLVDLEPGRYHLIVSGPRSDSPMARQVFYFKVKE